MINEIESNATKLINTKNITYTADKEIVLFFNFKLFLTI